MGNPKPSKPVDPLSAMNRTDAPDERAAAKARERAVRMYNAGMSKIDIAAETGIPYGRVKEEIIHGLREYADEPIEYKAMGQINVLRDLRRALYTSAMSGDVKAIDRMLRVMDHEAKLLGMYAPQRVQAVIGSGVSEAEFAVTMEALLKRAGREVPRHIAASAADGRAAGIAIPAVVVDGDVAS